MLKNKLIVSMLVMNIASMSAFPLSLSEIQLPKPPAYRVGISSTPEKQYIKPEPVQNNDDNISKLGDSEQINTADMTYADLSIKRLSKEISQELMLDEEEMISDLSLLWQGAATQSDTINFALYKLSNPDADKPDKNSLKKVLTTIASMSTLVGAGIGNPIIAGTSLIGGNMLGIMSQDTKALNYKYTKVTDADMIILVRKVEDLQQTAINLYYDYISAKKQYEMATNLVEERARKFELAQKNNAQRELIVITDAYYRTALDRQRTAKSDFFSKRAALEQFVGNETFLQFEAELVAREKGLKTAATEQASAKNEKQETVKENVYNEENLSQIDNLEEISQEDDNEKIAFLGRNKNKNDENENIEQTKEPKKKVDKYSTKGLIFVHDKDSPSYQRYQPDKAKVKQVSSKKDTEHEKKSEQTTKNQQVAPKSEFLPLEEIKAPDLFKDGYSIHEDL